jgi:hypothetical protein
VNRRLTWWSWASARTLSSQTCSDRTSAVGRMLGSFSKHCDKKARSASVAPSGTGGGPPSTIRYMTGSRDPRARGSASVAPAHRRLRGAAPAIPLAHSANGGRPVISSMMTQPSDQMSDAVDAPSIWMTSGATGDRASKRKGVSHAVEGASTRLADALQFGVPATSFSFFCSTATRLSETPKSESLTLPTLVVRMLAALRSQWTTCSEDDSWVRDHQRSASQQGSLTDFLRVQVL